MSLDKMPDHFIRSVFQNMSAKDLLRFRLVCRNWAAIISDSIELRRKPSYTVSNELSDRHAFVQTILQSPYKIFSNIRLRNVTIESSEMMTSLWNEIGTSIEKFSIELRRPLPGGAYISGAYWSNWIRLLKHMPNLVELKIDIKCLPYNYFIQSKTVDIIGELDLKKLDKVALSCENKSLTGHIMKLLTKCANKLTSIQVSDSTLMDCDTFYSLIESQRHSLKILELGGWNINTYLHKYLTIDNLSLEVLRLHRETPVYSNLLEILGNHKNLRELSCQVERFQLFPTYLPKLEKLELSIFFEENEEYRELPRNLINLISLKVDIDWDDDEIVSFKSLKNCPRLEYLEITSVRPANFPADAFQCFIDDYSKLRVLKIRQYRCNYRIVAIIADRLVHLEELSLRVCETDLTCDRIAFSNISKLNKLRHLEVIDYICICDDRFFSDHLRLPTLTSLSLTMHDSRYRTIDVTDRGILALTNNCCLLEELYLTNVCIPEDCLDIIPEKLVHLRRLSINSSYNRKLYILTIL